MIVLDMSKISMIIKNLVYFNIFNNINFCIFWEGILLPSCSSYIIMDKTVESIISTYNMTKHAKLSAILKYIFVDLCKIDQTKYYILGSYALREKRKINDLDVNLDYHEFCKLLEAVGKNLGNIQFYNDQVRWFFDMTSLYNKLNNAEEQDFSIEAFQKMPDQGFPDSEFSLGFLRHNNGLETDQNNHQFFNTTTLLKWKKRMNRPKDQEDIKLIEGMVGGQSRNSKSKKLKSKSKSKSKKLKSRSKSKSKSKKILKKK